MRCSGKEKANGILGCTKKNPLCHSTSPGETVSGLSTLFGAVIPQQHRALTCCFTPPWLLHPHVCPGTSLLAAPLMLCVCSSQSGARRASPNTHVVGPCWIILTSGASQRIEEGTEKKLETGLTALIPLVSLLTPSKTDQPFTPPWDQEPTLHATSPPLPLWTRDRTSAVGSKLPFSPCKGWGSAQSQHPECELRQAIISWVFSLTFMHRCQPIFRASTEAVKTRTHMY